MTVDAHFSALNMSFDLVGSRKSAPVAELTGAAVAAKARRLGKSELHQRVDDDRNPFNLELPKGFFYLELFCGSGRMSKSLRTRLESAGKQDIEVIGFDLLQGRSGDLLNNDVFQKVMAMINSGRCLGVWMAPPCATWSTSRRHDEHKGAPRQDERQVRDTVVRES